MPTNAFKFYYFVLQNSNPNSSPYFVIVTEKTARKKSTKWIIDKPLVTMTPKEQQYAIRNHNNFCFDVQRRS